MHLLCSFKYSDNFSLINRRKFCFQIGGDVFLLLIPPTGNEKFLFGFQTKDKFQPQIVLTFYRENKGFQLKP